MMPVVFGMEMKSSIKYPLARSHTATADFEETLEFAHVGNAHPQKRCFAA